MVPRKYQLVENRQCTSQSKFLPGLLIFEATHIVAEQSHKNDLMTIDDGSVNYFGESWVFLHTVHDIFLQVESVLLLVL